MTESYKRPAPTGYGLRLHLNENTAGCSPKVLEALAGLSATDVAFYPDYDAVYREAAEYLGVPEDRLLLVNGLDEGLLMATIVALRGLASDGASAGAKWTWDSSSARSQLISSVIFFLLIFRYGVIKNPYSSTPA